MLIEQGFMTNVEDFRWMINPANQEIFANEVVTALLSFFPEAETDEPTPEPTPEPMPEPTPTPAPTPPPRQPLSLVPGVTTLPGIDGNGNPITVHGAYRNTVNTVNRQMVGMISLAAIADWLDADISFAAGVITLTALNATGVSVTVTMQLGNNTANISGVGQVDIATFAGGHSGPANSVRPIILDGNRSFVPLRFVTEAFGFEVDASNFPVVIIR